MDHSGLGGAMFLEDSLRTLTKTVTSLTVKKKTKTQTQEKKNKTQVDTLGLYIW